jgi:high-affinity Fe2+/Pb2+ permease
MKKNKYTFLEWVFDRVGFGKFILFFYVFLLLIAIGLMSFVWWYTKDYR